MSSGTELAESIARLPIALAPSPAVVSDLLTIVLVTSPVAINPSTQLIDTVIQSFKLVRDLDSKTKLIIVCDGVKESSAERCRWKHGKVDDEAYANYMQYGQNLRDKYCSVDVVDSSIPTVGPHEDHVEDVYEDSTSTWSGDVEVLGPLPEHHGFAHSLLAGLEKVTTP